MWKESYSIGVDFIDQQHKELFKKVEELLIEIRSNGLRHKERCIETIVFLKEYALNHFADEEAYQLSTGYKEHDSHKKQHEKFVEILLRHEKKMAASDFAEKDVIEFLEMLFKWLSFHVADADKKMKKNENSLVFYVERNQWINEAVSNLAVKIHAYKNKYGKKSIILTGCGASNGTTMIAIDLAVALVRSGYRTLLVDADMRTRTKHRSRMADIGLCDVIRGLYSVEETIQLTNVDGLQFMPSGNYNDDPALLLCSRQASEFIAKISSEYDFVIIDSPAVTVVPEASALFMSVDGIILVCALNKTTKKQLQNAKDIIEPYADKYYGLAVNSVDERQYRRLFPNHGYYLRKAWRTEIKNRGKRDD